MLYDVNKIGNTIDALLVVCLYGANILAAEKVVRVEYGYVFDQQSTVINSSLLDASITSVAFLNNEQIVNLCHFYLLIRLVNELK